MGEKLWKCDDINSHRQFGETEKSFGKQWRYFCKGVLSALALSSAISQSIIRFKVCQSCFLVVAVARH